MDPLSDSSSLWRITDYNVRRICVKEHELTKKWKKISVCVSIEVGIHRLV